MGKPHRVTLRVKDMLIAAILFVAASLSVGWAYHSDFQIAWTYEFSNYADIGRQIGRGSYTAQFAYPVEMAYLGKVGQASPPWPVQTRFPLFSLLLSVVFLALGANDGSFVLVSALAWGTYVATLFLVGRKLFPQPPWAPLFAAILTLMCPLVWRSLVLWGYTSDILFATFFLIHAWLLCRALESGRTRDLCAAGAAAALCYYCRFNFNIYLPAAFAMLWQARPGQRGRGLAAYLLSYWIATWPLRLFQHAGTAASIYLFGNLFTIDTPMWLNFEIPDVGRVLPTLMPVLLVKFHYYLLEQLTWIAAPMHQWFVTPLVLVGLLRPRKQWPVQTRFLVFYFFCLAIHLAVFSFLRIETEGRYLLWLCPCLLYLAAQGFQQLHDVCSGEDHRRRLAVWLLTGLFSFLWLSGELRFYVLAPSNPEWVGNLPQNTELPLLRKTLAARLAPKALGISNVGVHLAWYLDRPCIDLPARIGDLQRLVEAQPVEYIYISRWPQGELFNRREWVDFMARSNWKKELETKIPIQAWITLNGNDLIILKPRT